MPLCGDCAHLNRLAEETFFLQLGLYLILFPSLGAMLLPLCIIVPASHHQVTCNLLQHRFPCSKPVPEQAQSLFSVSTHHVTGENWLLCWRVHAYSSYVGHTAL